MAKYPLTTSDYNSDFVFSASIVTWALVGVLAIIVVVIVIMAVLFLWVQLSVMYEADLVAFSTSTSTYEVEPLLTK